MSEAAVEVEVVNEAMNEAEIKDQVMKDVETVRSIEEQLATKEIKTTVRRGKPVQMTGKCNVWMNVSGLRGRDAVVVATYRKIPAAQLKVGDRVILGNNVRTVAAIEPVRVVGRIPEKILATLDDEETVRLITN